MKDSAREEEKLQADLEERQKKRRYCGDRNT
jgi:hypothetical protein